jgi:hypothetical protein
MRGRYPVILFLGFIVGACAARAVNPGVTLWAGLNDYHDKMRGLETRPERWPDRQRLGESIKTTHLGTLGGSREFNLLIDLDLRRRELIIAQREGVKPDRARQIDEELRKVDEQIRALLPVVKAQLTNAPARQPEPPDAIEAVATVGLLHLAIEDFSPAGAGSPPHTTALGGYVVSDEGGRVLVTSPEGRKHRCLTELVPQQGAFMRCTPDAPR